MSAVPNTVTISSGNKSVTLTDEQLTAAANAKRMPTPTEWLAEFRRQYEAPLQRAKAAAAMTATDAWQAAYAAQQAASGNRVKMALKELHDCADSIESMGLSEDVEKSVKDAVKDLTTEREGRDAYMSRAVMPHIKCVDECRTIREKAEGKAREVAREAPLMLGSNTFAADVLEIIKTWDRPEWDSTTGVVSIN